MAIFITKKALNEEMSNLRKEMEAGFVSLTEAFAEEDIERTNKINALEAENGALRKQIKEVETSYSEIDKRTRRAFSSMKSSLRNPRRVYK